jgi:hypothetical protein
MVIRTSTGARGTPWAVQTPSQPDSKWFGSLNFQATGNGYFMRITNRDELHPWRSTGPGSVPVMPTADAPMPVQADAADPSAP